MKTIQSEYGKIRTRKTPNTDTFHAVWSLDLTFNSVSGPWPKLRKKKENIKKVIFLQINTIELYK